MNVGEVEIFEDRAGLLHLLSPLPRLKHGEAAPDEGEQGCYGVRCRPQIWMDTDDVCLQFSRIGFRCCKMSGCCFASSSQPEGEIGRRAFPQPGSKLRASSTGVKVR